jgi:hypothetical protein
MAGDQFIAALSDQCRAGQVFSSCCCGPCGMQTNTCCYDPVYHPGDKELPCCAVDVTLCCVYTAAGGCSFPVGFRRAENFLCQLGCPCCVFGLLKSFNCAQISGTSHVCGCMRAACLCGTNGLGDGTYRGHTFLKDGTAPLMDVPTCACCFLQCYPAVDFCASAPHRWPPPIAMTRLTK